MSGKSNGSGLFGGQGQDKVRARKCSTVEITRSSIQKSKRQSQVRILIRVIYDLTEPKGVRRSRLRFRAKTDLLSGDRKR